MVLAPGRCLEHVAGRQEERAGGGGGDEAGELGSSSSGKKLLLLVRYPLQGEPALLCPAGSTGAMLRHAGCRRDGAAFCKAAPRQVLRQPTPTAWDEQRLIILHVTARDA